MGCRGSKKKRSQHTARRTVKSGVKSTTSDVNDYAAESEVSEGEGSGSSGTAASKVQSQAPASDVLNVRIKISDETTSKVLGKPSSGMRHNILGKSSLPTFPNQMASKLKYQSELNSKYSQFDSRFDGSSVLSQAGSSVLSSQIHQTSQGSAVAAGSNLSSSNMSSAVSSGVGSSVISQSTAGSNISQGGSSLSGSKFQSSIKKGRSRAGRSSLPKTTTGSKVGGKASKFLAEKGRVGTTPSQIFTKYLDDKKGKKSAKATSKGGSKGR